MGLMLVIAFLKNFEPCDQIHEINITLKFIDTFEVVIHKTLIVQVAHFVYSILPHDLTMQVILKYKILFKYISKA